MYIFCPFYDAFSAQGAVQYGLDPSIVHVRRAKCTYGIGVIRPFIQVPLTCTGIYNALKFDQGVHPIDKLVVRGGRTWCMDLLDVFVRAGQSVSRSSTLPLPPSQLSPLPSPASQSFSHFNFLHHLCHCDPFPFWPSALQRGGGGAQLQASSGQPGLSFDDAFIIMQMMVHNANDGA